MTSRLRLFLFSFFLIAVFFFPAAHAADFKQNPQIAAVRPPSPVSIELKRDQKGEYSWKLSGTNVNEIIRIDQKLRNYTRQDGKKEEK